MTERNYRRDDNIRQTGRYAYIDGSTVRKLQTRPVPEKRETERRQEQPRRRKRTSGNRNCYGRKGTNECAGFL